MQKQQTTCYDDINNVIGMSKRNYLLSKNTQFLESAKLTLFIVGCIISLFILSKGVFQSQELRSKAIGENPYYISPTPACNKEPCSILNETRHCADQILPSPKQGFIPIKQAQALFNKCVDYKECYQKCQNGTGSCAKKLVWSECSLDYRPSPTSYPTPGITKIGSCSPTCSVNTCIGYPSTQQICTFGTKSKWGKCDETCQLNETRSCQSLKKGTWLNGIQTCEGVRKNFKEYCETGYWSICKPSNPS